MKGEILIITSEFPPQPGGIGNHAHNLAYYLSINGKQVSVMADYRDANTTIEDHFDQSFPYKVIRIPRYNVVLRTYVQRIICCVKSMGSHKVIIASGKFSMWIVAILGLFFTKQKKVLIVHGSELSKGGNVGKKLTAWSLKQFDEVIAVSNFTKKLALSRQSNINVEVINNGYANRHEFHNATKDDAILNLVTVGNVTHRKGQHNVINALPLLVEKFPEIRYHCIGIPTDKQRLVDLAKRLGVEDKVVFHGALSDENLYKILSKSHVFIMLSDSRGTVDVEGFGIAILEANSIGLPSIGSVNTGIQDAIKHGYSGRLVDAYHPQEIVSALEDIMSNYEEYSKHATEWSKEFTWDNVIKKYLKILES